VSIRGSPCWLPWLHGSFTSRACRSRKGTCCRACRLSRMYTHTLSVFQWCWNAHAGPFEHTHTTHYLHTYCISHDKAGSFEHIQTFNKQGNKASPQCICYVCMYTQNTV
jgi:hypothetical protein